MKCTQCQFENIAGAKFCNECGTKLDLACPQCGNVNPDGSKFCNQCGYGLSSGVASAEPTVWKNLPPKTPFDQGPPLKSDGERCQATILFSDLSGYTSMNERLDPEEVEVIMRRIKKEAVKIVERHEGIVNQFVGDEVLALFGIPVAHEDDPIRAVRAAMEIHRLVRHISVGVEDRTGTQLRMHTGISTGLVVTHMRDDRDGRYGITGDAVNIGARLASIAEADAILAGPETQRLIAPYFETEPQKAANVKGKTRPVASFRIIKESTVHTRFDAARMHGLTDFTGRENELTTLYAGLEKTLAGSGQLVTVVGEAGLGKSRLMYEFRHSLNRSEITVLQGRCQSYGSSMPYFPHINAFRRGLNLKDSDTPAQLHEKTVANIMAIDPSLDKYLPIFLHLLSIPSTDYPLSENLHGHDLTLAIQEALTASFILNSKKQPLILIFEDWHWVDDASDALLKQMVSLIASHALMILVIYRPDYPANWGNWSHHTPLNLTALDLLNCERIIKSIWKADHLPKGIVSLFHDRTGGNPFFVEEVSRSLIEEGTCECKDRQAVLTRSLENLSLPDTVQAVIRARLDRLDRYPRESLRLASVIGREFARRILEHISASKEQLTQALETLKFLELIQQTQIVPEAAYMFKHVITQEVTYETLLKQKRKELHTAVGRAIEELYMDRLEEFYEMLAYHFWRGEDWDRAYNYNREAGLKAQSLSAYIEAKNFLEAALVALSKLPRSRTHLEQEIDLRFNMRSALFPLGRHDDWADHIRVAETLAREIKDKTRLANAHNFLAGYHWIRGRHQEAIKLGQESLRLAQSIGDFSVEITTKLHLGIPFLYTGEIERQVALHREAVEQLTGPAALKRHGFSTVPAITLRGYLAWGLAERGDFEEAEMWAQEGMALSGHVKNLFSTGFVQACAGFVCLRKGDTNNALNILLKTKAMNLEAELQSIFAFVAGSLGNAYLQSDRPEKALPILIEAADRRYLESSITPPLYTITALSEAYRRQGEIDKAVEAVEKALQIFHQNGERGFGAWTLYTAAKIQSERNQKQTAQAIQTLHKAMDLAQTLKMKPLLAHCYFELGKLSLKLKSEDAHRAILKAIDLYRSLGMKFWLPEAEDLLRQAD